MERFPSAELTNIRSHKIMKWLPTGPGAAVLKEATWVTVRLTQFHGFTCKETLLWATDVQK